jgi:2-oxoglutarate ferredoxin oxidoreductase subunit delta
VRGAEGERGLATKLAPVSKTRIRVSVIIDEEMCKGCGLCISACPRHAMGLASHINTRGFHPAAPLCIEKCNACAQCAIMCPDSCITILKSE